MSQGLNMKVNRLPAPTWNWLHMNETIIEDVSVQGEGWMEVETPETIQYTKETKLNEKTMETALGSDMDKLLEQGNAGGHVFRLEGGLKEARPVRLHFHYEEGQHAADRIELYAGDGSEMTVIMDFRSDQDAKGLAGLQTRLYVGDNAKIRLVQVQMLGDGFRCLNDIGGKTGQDGQIEVIQLVLSGSDTYMGIHAALEGKASGLTSDLAYIVKKNAKLDTNYVALHTGKKTTSQINASGVLSDQAFKLFRGTIDFRRGSSGAVGNEKEEVLLLSDDVVNQTIPLILCEEEDVEGNHGASIGKLDENLLFYMASRGIPEDQVYHMMARAKVDAVSRKIPDEETRDMIAEFLGEDDQEKGEQDGK